MTSKEKIKDIRALINEIYEDETDESILKSRDCFREYCSDIEKDLDDFAWLKSKISIDFVSKLSPDDAIRLYKILGFNYGGN